MPNPSVLVVQKLTREEQRLAEAGALDNYDVFMAIPKTAGIDKRGNPLHQRTPEGLDILDETLQKVVDDEIGQVANDFSQWIRESSYVRH